MNRISIRLILSLCTLWLVSLGFAGTLTVTSPTNNAYISPSSNVTFNISGASVQVTVKVVVTFPDGSTTSSTQQVIPDSTGNATGSIATNLSSSNPEGVYKFSVSATEPNNTYTSTNFSVTLLPVAPKFNSFSPVDGTFLSGTVHIRAVIADDHLQQWTVLVGGQNIPNNTGTTDAVSVDWNTGGITTDGPQDITITATDLAGQVTSTTISVTICRVAPIITIEYPSTTTHILPGSNISVVLSIQGEFANSVDRTGVVVTAMTLNNAYLMRIPFVSMTSGTGTTSIWTGRIRYVPNKLPSSFRLIVTAADKAGNYATPQRQVVNVGS